MTSLKPRDPYSPAELQALYPSTLALRQVQILLRHGERTPITSRFENTGLPAFWPYCRDVTTLRSALLNGRTNGFTSFEWKRHLETFASDSDDSPKLVWGPHGDVDGICDNGTLTDQGRQTTHALGIRLRDLYVDQLGFLPKTINSTDWMYLRATPIPRARESLQQVFLGLYPEEDRSPGMPAPAIISRNPAQETLYPNDLHCRRLAHLARQFSKRAAERWNESPELRYINNRIGKWMPANRRVAIDSKPSLVGVLDTVNATLAHGPSTRLPAEFYDPLLLEIGEKLAIEEWFAGYAESNEYRKLGIGSLLGDVVQRMVISSAQDPKDEPPLRQHQHSYADPQRPIKFAMSGCHDTTLAATLTSLGDRSALKKWPPFTSHIAFELFSRSGGDPPRTDGVVGDELVRNDTARAFLSDKERWGEKEEKALDGWFVRVRYNDEPLILPGCRKPGNHLDGDVSFCTLVSCCAFFYSPFPGGLKLIL